MRVMVVDEDNERRDVLRRGLERAAGTSQVHKLRWMHPNIPQVVWRTCVTGHNLSQPFGLLVYCESVLASETLNECHHQVPGMVIASASDL